MNELKTKFLQIIKSNEIENLKLFIQENDIKNNNFDLLTFAIENNVSLSLIEIILSKYNSINYIFNEPRTNNIFRDSNIDRLQYQEIKNPLFSAIARNNFKLADYLIKNYSANINITYNGNCNILEYFYNNGNENQSLFNKNNIKYILTHEFNYIDCIHHLIWDIIKTNKPFFINLFEVILSYSLFSNDLILKLLFFYSNNISLSDKQLLNTFQEIIPFSDFFFQKYSPPNKLNIMKLLFQYNISSKEVLYRNINTYYFNEYNIRIYGYRVVEEVLSFKNLNFKVINFENALFRIISQEKLEIMKNLFYKIIYHPNFHFNDINLGVRF